MAVHFTAGKAWNPFRECEPLTYYHITGPLGQFFAALEDQTAQWRVAAVGLGAGSIASYRRPGQAWTFYEVDPTVVQLARDPRFFTYLSKCSYGHQGGAGRCSIIIGQGTQQPV